jgi:hypothetical protein
MKLTINMGICMVAKKAKQMKNKPEVKVIDSEDIIFPDMPEWEGKISITLGEKYKGVGIKQMKGYKCDIPINELNKLREAFWGTFNH